MEARGERPLSHQLAMWSFYFGGATLLTAFPCFYLVFLGLPIGLCGLAAALAALGFLTVDIIKKSRPINELLATLLTALVGAALSTIPWFVLWYLMKEGLLVF